MASGHDLELESSDKKLKKFVKLVISSGLGIVA